MTEGLRVVAGTDADFASYVTARRPALLRFARAVAGDPHTADDLLQAALVKVLPRWQDLRDRDAADGYVRRTIANLHVSWHRQPWRHAEQSVAWLTEHEGASHAVPDADVDAGHLWSLVQALPPVQRATVALRYYEELSVAETAAVLGSSTGTVKSNTSRALATLRLRADDAALAG